MQHKLYWRIAFALALTGCNAPAPPAAQATDAEQGLVVVETDYQSSNVGLLGEDGSVLSPSLVSSGSGTMGLSALLSGDTVLPGPALHGSIVVIDRASAVLSWVDPATARVTAQLSVATGFYSNPQDYVQAAPDRAYVPRLAGNHDPGQEPFDGGNDVLVIDPGAPRVTGRIDLVPAMKGEDPKYLPRANRVVMADGQLDVLLSGYAEDFCDSSPESRVASIDPATNEIGDVLVLAGLHGCTAMSLSPDGGTLAVNCSGFHQCGDPVMAESGVALVSLGPSLAVERRFAATDLGQGALAFGVGWAGPHTLLVSSFGREADASGPARKDSLLELDTTTGAHRLLLQSDAFALGEVRCVPGEVCFAADAGRGVVYRFGVDASGQLGSAEPAPMHSGAGLPPRYLGWFDASGG